MYGTKQNVSTPYLWKAIELYCEEGCRNTESPFNLTMVQCLRVMVDAANNLDYQIHDLNYFVRKCLGTKRFLEN
ncbi:hypothetical protein TNCV_3520461 [Trichonephila clavipes]|nr:hypothetical protein TNCV_3520461 [Trichonephila clavipes]